MTDNNNITEIDESLNKVLEREFRNEIREDHLNYIPYRWIKNKVQEICNNVNQLINNLDDDDIKKIIKEDIIDSEITDNYLKALLDINYEILNKLDDKEKEKNNHDEENI
jgi:hypothetical protein